MNRSGIVVDSNKNFAKVRILKHTACGDCGACHLGDDNKDMDIEARNEIGAVKGDHVMVDLETPNVLKAAFIIYTIPLLSLLVGIAFGTIFMKKEIYAAVLGLLLLATSYIIIKKHEDTFKNSGKYHATITKITKSTIQEGLDVFKESRED